MGGEVAEASAAALQEKMSKWDATEEEQRAKTLGGNLPLVGMPGKPSRVTRKDQPKKMDGFDIGMTASAVVLVPLALAVLAFPFFIGSVDISSGASVHAECMVSAWYRGGAGWSSPV